MKRKRYPRRAGRGLRGSEKSHADQAKAAGKTALELARSADRALKQGNCDLAYDILIDGQAKLGAAREHIMEWVMMRRRTTGALPDPAKRPGARDITQAVKILGSVTRGIPQHCFRKDR